MNARETHYADYLGFLQSLHKAGADFFVEGGQAVNFWAEYIDSSGRMHALDPLRPFTSKDCDVWVSSHAWEKIKQNPGGILRKSTSPADGQLAILTLDQEPPLVVDLMTTVYGLRLQDLPRLLERALDDGGVKVLDPIYLFLSKCHCLLGLDQSGRQDERHVRMLALILPEYLSLLMVNAGEEDIPDRAILREIKLLLKILGSRACRRATDELEIKSDSIIPWERMETCDLKAIEDFARAEGRRRPSQA